MMIKRHDDWRVQVNEPETITIKIERHDDGDMVYVNGEKIHEHGWRSLDAVDKWIDLIRKYIPSVNISIEYYGSESEV